MVMREEIYELVWSQPMIRVAEKFEVSGSYLARVCTELRVPRPERGYWAKLAVGKAPQRPALPEPLPGEGQFAAERHLAPIACRLGRKHATSHIHLIEAPR